MEIKSGLANSTKHHKSNKSIVMGVHQRGNKYLLGGENEWPGALSMAGKA
jgi:hypothetical protein